MKKYVVGRMCKALEWVFVEADSKEEAITKAEANEEVHSASHQLEFREYLDTDSWITKELKPNGLKYEEEN